MDYKEQIEALKNLEAIAYGYNINGEVLGMDCSDFEQIMVDAADAITDLLARAEAADILGDNYDLDRLRELVEADRDGRCVVLPCKIGTPVYRILWHCGCAALDDESYKYVGFPVPFTFDMINQFGKSVFLTSEEAEEAMKERIR